MDNYFGVFTYNSIKMSYKALANRYDITVYINDYFQYEWNNLNQIDYKRNRQLSKFGINQLPHRVCSWQKYSKLMLCLQTIKW